jgi:hypothetical protein
LDYHQGNDEYRQEHWGELFPTSTIEIYEWTKSPVTPDEHMSAVRSGTIIDGVELTGLPYTVTDNLGETQYYWTEEIELNVNTNQLETYFYYWVKNKTTVPNPDRQFSVLQLSSIVRSPDNEEITWLAATSENTLLVSGLTNVIGFDDLVMQVNFDNSNVDYHQEFILLPEGDPTLIIPEWLHISLRDSLAGFTQLTETYPFTVWDSTVSYSAGEVVRGTDSNFYFAATDSVNQDPTTDSSNDFWYLTDIDEINPNGDYSNIDTVSIRTPYNIPDLTLHPFARLGLETRPHQTWFVDIDHARQAVVEKINDQLLGINLINTDIPWREEFDRTVSVGGLDIDITDYWSFADWSLPGGPAHDLEVSDFDVQTVDDLAGLSPLEGNIAHVLTSNDIDGISRYSSYIYQNSEWVLFFKERATIQFNDLLWNSTVERSGWDTSGWDTREWDLSGTVALVEIFDSFYNRIWIQERRVNYVDLWFHMARYVLSEQEEVDWIFKTSYIKLVFEDMLEKNYNQYFKQNITELFDYINTVKPFRSKLRDSFTRTSADELFISNAEDLLQVRVQTNPTDSTVDETTTRAFRLHVGSNGTNYSSYIVNDNKVLLGLDIGATDTVIPYLIDSPNTLRQPGVTIETAGTGYVIGDQLIISGGTVASEDAILEVAAVDGSGGVTEVTIVNIGEYRELPVAPYSVTGGSGIGATFSGVIPFSDVGVIWINSERIEYDSITTITTDNIGSGFSSGFSSGFGGIALLTGCVRGTQETFARPHSFADVIEDGTGRDLREFDSLSSADDQLVTAWNRSASLLETSETTVNGDVIRGTESGALTANNFGTIDVYGDLFAFRLLALSESADAIKEFQSELEELIETYWSTI